jgi:transposase
MSNFRDVDRQIGFLLPPSVDEWLPQRHLARFVVEVIDGLDLRALVGSYRGSGSASYHPSMLLGLLVYGYATGVFASRKLERATYDSVAFRFIAANDHPDHDTIATFRRRFLKEITELFVKVLMLAREMGVLQLGTVALDGTKIHANASRHSALSYEHAGKLEAQLKAEVGTLLATAEAADQADLPDGMSIPEELERREARLKKLAAARAKIAARASERLAREQAEYETKMAARQAKARAHGKKPGGKPPAPPVAGPGPSDQINLTDADSRIMPVAGGGFEQCYNAQAAVTADSLLVVATDVVQAANSLPSRKRGTSSKSSRCWASWRHCRRTWAGRKPCSATMAISVPPMSQPVLRPRSRRCSRPDGRRITPPWTSALPRHRRRQSTRRRSKPCCIAWRRLKARSSTRSANISRSRCSASSSRFSASDNFCCAGSTRFAASGAW